MRRGLFLRVTVYNVALRKGPRKRPVFVPVPGRPKLIGLNVTPGPLCKGKRSPSQAKVPKRLDCEVPFGSLADIGKELGMSALPLRADTLTGAIDVRFVPETDIDQS